jgi:hypothetical protein
MMTGAAAENGCGSWFFNGLACASLRHFKAAPPSWKRDKRMQEFAGDFYLAEVRRVRP